MASGLYTFVAGAKPTATEWNDYIGKQAVGVYSSAADRNTQTSGKTREGMLAALTDEERVYAFDGAAWVRTGMYWSAAGRTGVRLRRAAFQSVPNGTLTAISFDTEDADSDGFIAVTGATITIPTGCDGVYVMTAEVFVAAATTGQVTITTNTGSTNNHNVDYVSPNQNPSITVVQALSATNTLQLLARQTTGGALNMSARFEMYRMGR